MKSVLFVCLGNICRSPTAEAVMKKMLEMHGLEQKVKVDSAGTSDYHVGEFPDARMRAHAHTRGYDLTSRARQLLAEDLATFDLIIGMDDSNVAHIQALDPDGKFKSKIFKLTDFKQSINAQFVPDPYYGGQTGFERVMDIIEDSCQGLIKRLEDL